MVMVEAVYRDRCGLLSPLKKSLPAALSKKQLCIGGVWQSRDRFGSIN